MIWRHKEEVLKIKSYLMKLLGIFLLWLFPTIHNILLEWE
jgi:hypothetical protein